MHPKSNFEKIAQKSIRWVVLQFPLSFYHFLGRPSKLMQYCESIFMTKRWKTREVTVGSVGIGGDNPVRIQSMTTSNTRDVDATVEQVIRLADAGCEIVRLTVQGIKEAEACEFIKNKLIQAGYTVPLVADIHFYPPAAMKVIDFVEKVRINPGNYVDKRANFKVIEYDDNSYAKELEKIEEKFTPLVEKCKLLKRAMRIGTNHGSLSDRIMNRYGDTPAGMVESALEFARICRKNNFHNFVFSMKASNPRVMILAYRLLVAEMIRLGWDYPLHLGVTEAGQGEDGRVKSAMGIGSLLLDGIGDTIRISLTEDPWLEMDPCRRLIQFGQSYQGVGADPFIEKHRLVNDIQSRSVVLPKELALHRDGSVLLNVSSDIIHHADFYKKLGCEQRLGKPKLSVASVDSIVLKGPQPKDSLSLQLKSLQQVGVGLLSDGTVDGAIPLLPLSEVIDEEKASLKFDLFSPIPSRPLVIVVKDETPSEWSRLNRIQPNLIFLKPSKDRLHYSRHFFEWLQEHRLKIPVILNFAYECPQEEMIIQASAECGALLCDGLGEGLCLEAPHDIDFIRNLSFNILQAARMRSSKTDFISCPSCGRTLFDLQDVTKRIQSRTAHLPGVKIAIMGCIVNGPGEMADADFGYVGSKPGMIDLYVGKQCVQKDIDFAVADDRLIELIKCHGRWIEPDHQEACK